MEQRERVRAFLTEQGYREFPVSNIDRHQVNWQKRSGVERDDGGAETERGYLNIREWQHDDLKLLRPDLVAVLHDSYEVVATFETPHGWLKLEFYSLNAEQLRHRLTAIEAEIRLIQRRLLGKEPI